MKSEAQRELDIMKMHHRNTGLMIGELQEAVDTYNDDTALYDAIGKVMIKYGIPVF